MNYVSNVIGAGLIDRDMPVEIDSAPTPTPVGAEGVVVLYGDTETGICVLVAAPDEDEAEARILRTFGVDVDVDFVEPSIDQRPYEVAGREIITWTAEPIIGERASYEVIGPWYRSTGSGIYLGVALDEEDGVPFHYFVRGQINDHPQKCHGFPAATGTPTTTDLTPTDLIQGALEVRS